MEKHRKLFHENILLLLLSGCTAKTRSITVVLEGNFDGISLNQLDIPDLPEEKLSFDKSWAIPEFCHARDPSKQTKGTSTFVAVCLPYKNTIYVVMEYPKSYCEKTFSDCLESNSGPATIISSFHKSLQVQVLAVLNKQGISKITENKREFQRKEMNDFMLKIKSERTSEP